MKCRTLGIRSPSSTDIPVSLNDNTIEGVRNIPDNLLKTADATKLNLKTFFNVTGVLLILFTGGLLAHGIHELQEAGLVPIVIEQVWDVNNILPESSIVGRFFSSVFGYNGNPSLIEVIFYTGYLVSMPFLFLNPRKDT